MQSTFVTFPALYLCIFSDPAHLSTFGSFVHPTFDHFCKCESTQVSTIHIFSVLISGSDDYDIHLWRVFRDYASTSEPWAIIKSTHTENIFDAKVFCTNFLLFENVSFAL